jgi:hypothetical protein
MDEITTLTRLRADLPDPTPPALAAARARLTDRISATTSPPRVATPHRQHAPLSPRRSLLRPRRSLLRPRRSLLRRPVTIGIAAAAAVATGVGVLTAGGSGHPATTPTVRAGVGPGAPALSLAARELDLAAVNTIKSGDPAVGAGQYTRVVTDSWRGEHVDGISFLQKGRLEVWVPAEGKGTWYWRETGRLGTKFATAADQRYMQTRHPDEFTPTVFLASGHNGRQDKALPADGPQPSRGCVATTKPADKSLPADRRCVAVVTKPDWDFPTPAWLVTQPRDPRALLAAIEAAQPKPAPGTRAKADTPTLAFFQIAHTLSTGIVPAELRAALYRAAIKLPGIELVSSTANIDGRKGIAIGRLEPFGYLRQEILFDAAGGQYIGEREVVVHSNADDAHLPVGATYSSTAVTVSVTGNPHLF